MFKIVYQRFELISDELLVDNEHDSNSEAAETQEAGQSAISLHALQADHATTATDLLTVPSIV